MVGIIVEGKTDEEFLEDFLGHLGFARDSYTIKVFDGKDNIFQLTHTHYDRLEKEILAKKIKALLIVCDADDPKDSCPIRGYDVTQNRLDNLITDLAFPLSVSTHIFCDEDRLGFLESFLLSVLDAPQKKCIANFKDCYQYNLTDKWIFNSFYKQKEHPFDYGHSRFDELKEKIQSLFEGTE